MSTLSLSDALGVSADTLASIWDQVRANSALLEGCTRHEFAPGHELGAKRRCVHCGGWLGATEAAWYERGIKHAAA